MLQEMGIPLLNACYKAVKKDGPPWTVEQCRQIAAALRSVTKNKNYIYLGENRRFISLVAAVHARAGQADEAIEWFAGLPSQMQNQLNELDRQMCPFDLVRRMSEPAGEGNVRQRMDAARNVLP